MAASPFVELEVSGHPVMVTNPDKPFFQKRVPPNRPEWIETMIDGDTGR